MFNGDVLETHRLFIGYFFFYFFKGTLERLNATFQRKYKFSARPAISAAFSCDIIPISYHLTAAAILNSLANSGPFRVLKTPFRYIVLILLTFIISFQHSLCLKTKIFIL